MKMSLFTLWLWMVFAILLYWLAVTQRLGKALACIFAPTILEVNNGGGNLGAFNTSQVSTSQDILQGQNSAT